MAIKITDDTENHEMIMIHEIGKLAKQCYDRKVRDLNLTRAQWHVLMILRRNPGISQAKLAEIIEVEPMSLCRLLDRMSRNGWIERQPDPNDRRANCIHLTKKANPLIGKLKEYSLELRQEFIKNLSIEEYENLLSSLGKIKKNMNEILGSDNK